MSDPRRTGLGRGAQRVWNYAGTGPEELDAPRNVIYAQPGALERARTWADRKLNQAGALGRQAVSTGLSTGPALLGLAEGGLSYGLNKAFPGEGYGGFGEGFRRGAQRVPGGLAVVNAANDWGDRYEQYGGPGWVRTAVDFLTPDGSELAGPLGAAVLPAVTRAARRGMPNIKGIATPDQIEMVPISKLKAFATEDRRVVRKDPRAMDVPTAEQLQSLTEQFAAGVAMREPIILHVDADGRALIGDGNTRLAALEDAGYTYAPVYVSRTATHGFGLTTPRRVTQERYVNGPNIMPSELGLMSSHPMSGPDPGIDPMTGKVRTDPPGTPTHVGLNEREVKMGVTAESKRVGALHQPEGALKQKGKALRVKKGEMMRDEAEGLGNEAYDAALARAKSNEHLRRAVPRGEYVGAPQGMRTKSHLRAARAEFDRLVALGARVGADWYDEIAAKFESQFDTVEKADTYARAHTVTSAQETPPSNADWAAKAHNAVVIGHPRTHAPTRAKAKKVQAAFDSPQMDNPAGADYALKTGSYRKGISPKFKGWIWGANDIWHARAWGFRNKKGGVFDGAPNKSQHVWMDAEAILSAERMNANAVGGRTDWTPARAQAAAWVAMRAEEMAKKSGIPIEEALQRAKGLYGDTTANRTTSLMHEAHPGGGTGHFPEMKSGSPESIEHSRRVFDIMDDDKGLDILVSAAGIPQAKRTNRTVGIWGSETNPARGVHVETGSDTYGPMVRRYNKEKKKMEWVRDIEGRDIPDDVRGALRLIETYRGAGTGQHGVGASLNSGTVYKNNATGVEITKPRGVDWTEAEIRGALGPVEGALGTADPTGFTASVGGGALRSTTSRTNTGRPPAIKIQRKLFEPILTALAPHLPPGATIKPMQADTDFFGTGMGSVDSGVAVRTMRDLAAKYPRVEEKLSSPEVMEMWGEVYDEILRMEGLGMTAREGVKNLVRESKKGGLKRVFEALDEGIVLPAAALFFLQTTLNSEEDALLAGPSA